MSEDLDKKFESIGFILDKSQFEVYQKICCKFKYFDSILECGLRGFEQIDFSKKDYLKSEHYKPGNVLLIPHKHNNFGWYLSPWLILGVDNGTTLHCMHAMFQEKFDENDSNVWKDSSIRKLLNSDEFLKRFPATIQKNVSFHDIWTDQKITSDRFWLLSWQDLGETEENNHDDYFTYDYPDKKARHNSDVFKTKEDLIKCFATYHDSWYLRSKRFYSFDCICFVASDGNIYSDKVTYYNGCAPTFILQ